MRHRQAKGIARGLGVGGGLLAVAMAGCLLEEQQHSTSWMDRFRGYQGSQVQDLVLLDVALIERPVHDPYISQELWDLADEQGVPLERKAILDDNGFRVGQVGGITPPGLQALLTSERSCVNPHRITTKAGTSKEVTVGLAEPWCRLQLVEDGQKETLDLEQIDFQFLVTPTLTKDGKVALRFVPRVRHGELQHRAKPTADRTGLVLQAERATRAFEGLAWDVTVPPGDYVLIGARIDKADSLGYHGFVRRDEAKPVQRLLVIRTARAETGAVQEHGPKPNPNDPIVKSPSLASQASMSAVRGKSQ